MARPRKVWAIDCETDPFQHGRIPEPFIWGAWNGKDFLVFDETSAFALWAQEERAILFAHNGGKFDFMFLLPFLPLQATTVRIINGRIVTMKFGAAELRDSWSVIPIKLADYRKDTMEYWKLEKQFRKQYHREIINYLRSDCVNLFDLVTEYRKQAGAGITIAGNAMAHARKLGIDPGKTNAIYDEKFRRFYYGGRCECLKPGRHKDVNVFDIKSAYPFAMTHEHATGNDYIDRPDWRRLDIDRLQRCFFTVECLSKGAFPLRVKHGLRFPWGKGVFHVTGWEFVVAIGHDLISDITVHECLEFYNTINFTPFVEHWFQHKETARLRSDKANTIIGKIMLNSLYGKLCQNPVTYKDYKLLPLGTRRERGWHIEAEIGDMELHSRPHLYKLMQKYGGEWKRFNCYFNVATGASITGFARAQLLDAAHKVGWQDVIYMDTDSLMVGAEGNGAALTMPGEQQLGSWVWEGRANPACVAGKKLYALKIVEGPKKGTKIACKGGALSFSEIDRLTQGATIEWKNPAPSFKLDGQANFIVRRFVKTA